MKPSQMSGSLPFINVKVCLEVLTMTIIKEKGRKIGQMGSLSTVLRLPNAAVTRRTKPSALLGFTVPRSQTDRLVVPVQYPHVYQGCSFLYTCGALRDGLAVKSTACSSQRLRLSSQLPHDSS